MIFTIREGKKRKKNNFRCKKNLSNHDRNFQERIETETNGQFKEEMNALKNGLCSMWTFAMNQLRMYLQLKVCADPRTQKLELFCFNANHAK